MLQFGSVEPGLVATDATVYVPYVNRRLVALDASTGATRWMTTAEDGLVRWPPCVTDAAVFVAGETSLQAFRR